MIFFSSWVSSLALINADKIIQNEQTLATSTRKLALCDQFEENIIGGTSWRLMTRKFSTTFLLAFGLQEFYDMTTTSGMVIYSQLWLAAFAQFEYS